MLTPGHQADGRLRVAGPHRVGKGHDPHQDPPQGPVLPELPWAKIGQAPAWGVQSGTPPNGLLPNSQKVMGLVGHGRPMSQG